MRRIRPVHLHSARVRIDLQNLDLVLVRVYPAYARIHLARVLSRPARQDKSSRVSTSSAEKRRPSYPETLTNQNWE